MRAKKLLSLLLVCVMLVGLFPASVFAASYGDTQGHWAQAAIDRWSDYGIVTGDAKGFRPNDNMTRAEAATVFSRLFGLSDAAAKTAFTDVAANDWFYEAVNKCVNAGIMNGVGDNQMNPNGTMTREMFFVMFARALGIKEQSTTKGLPADGDSWANGYINTLTDKGFVQGMDGKVNALANINRASVMALLDQTIKQYVNASGTTTLNADKGVVLVNAKNVTLTGTTAADIVIAQGADGGNVDFVKATVTGAVTAQAANATITSDKDSKITTPVINGANTTYTAAGAATVSGGGGGGYSGGTPAVDPATLVKDKITSDLSDATYENLTIGAELGDGEITLERVTVTGTLYVRGGGDHSIKLVESNVNTIDVNKPASAGSEETRLLLDRTSPATITAASGTIIEAEVGSDVTVGKVEASNAVTLKGPANIESVTASGSSTEVVLDSTYTGAVEKVTASGSATITANAGTIAEVEASGGAKIEGSSATAVKAVTASGNVTVNTKVETVTAANNATLTLGASADVADVTAKGSLTVSAASGDAGKIGTLTATTGTITVAAPTAQIATVEAKATESGPNSVAITVTSGTVSEVVASAANTTVGGDGTVANVTANSAVSVDAKTVEKVTVATTETITVSAASAGDTVDVAVTGGTEVNLEAKDADAASAIVVSSTNASADVSNVKITNKATNETTAVTHVHTWDAGVVKEGDKETCTTDGKMTYTCQTAGCNGGTPLTKTVVIPATGHKWSTTGVVTTPAGHTTTGVLTYHCENDVDHTYTETIPATGHVNNETAASSYRRDATYHWHECEDNDGGILHRSAHNYANVVSVSGSVVTVMPTCTVCGYEDEAHKKEASTLAYIQLAYTEKDGVKTITGNDLKNSNNRNFYSAGTTPATQTLTLYSTVELAGAATTASNWDVKDGAGNALTGLTLTSVAKNANVTVGETTFYSYTLTFTPQDVDKDTADNQYSVSGSLRITPNDAALGKVENAQVTLANSEGYVKAGVPGVVAVGTYATTVDRWGKISVATPSASDIETRYLVSGKDANGKDVDVAAAMKKLATKKYCLTTEAELEAALKAVNGNVAVTTISADLNGSKEYNGQYVVGAVYSKGQLDGYGVSAPINVNGFTPDTLNPTLARDGKITVTRVNETKWVAGEEGASGAWASTTSGVEVTDNELYLVRPKANTTPVFSFDTLSNAADVTAALKAATGKNAAEADIETLEDKTKPGWFEITYSSSAWNKTLTAEYNGCYLLAVLTDTTTNRDAEHPTKSFSSRVVAFGAAKVNMATAPQLGLLTDALLAEGADVLGKLPSDLVTADTIVTVTQAEGTNTYNVAVTGKAYYITGWTQFSGNSAEQDGHFLPLRITKPVGLEVTNATLQGSGEAKSFTFSEEEENAEYLILRTDAVKAANKKFVVKATVKGVEYTFNVILTNLTEESGGKSELVFAATTTSDSGKLLGKSVSDMITSDTPSGGSEVAYTVTTAAGTGAYDYVVKVTGQAKYIAGWTNFSGKTEEQYGYYVPLKITAPSGVTPSGYTMTAQGVGKTVDGKDKPKYSYPGFFGTSGNYYSASPTYGDDLIMLVGKAGDKQLANFTVTIDWDGEGATYLPTTYLVDLSGVTLEEADTTYNVQVKYKENAAAAEQTLGEAIYDDDWKITGYRGFDGTDGAPAYIYGLGVGNITTSVTISGGTDTILYNTLKNGTHSLWAAKVTYSQDFKTATYEVFGKYGTIAKDTSTDALKVTIAGNVNSPEAYAGTAGFPGEVAIFYAAENAETPEEVDEDTIVALIYVNENEPEVYFTRSENEEPQYTIPASAISNVYANRDYREDKDEDGNLISEDLPSWTLNSYNDSEIPLYQCGESFSFAGETVSSGHFIAVRAKFSGNFDPEVATIAVSGKTSGTPVTIASANDCETAGEYYVDLILRLDDVMAPSAEKEPYYNKFTVTIDWDGEAGENAPVTYTLNTSELKLAVGVGATKLTYNISYTALGKTYTDEDTVPVAFLTQGTQVTSLSVAADNVYGTVPVWNNTQNEFEDVAFNQLSKKSPKIAVVMDGKVVNADYGVVSIEDSTATITLDGEGHEYDGYAGALGWAVFYVYTDSCEGLVAAVKDLSPEQTVSKGVFHLYVLPMLSPAKKINPVYGTEGKVDLFGTYMNDGNYESEITSLNSATLKLKGEANYVTVKEFMNDGTDATKLNGYYIAVEMAKPDNFNDGFIVVDLGGKMTAIPVPGAFDETRTIKDKDGNETEDIYKVFEMVIKVSDATDVAQRNWKVYYCYGGANEKAALAAVNSENATYTYIVDYSGVTFVMPTEANLTYSVSYKDLSGDDKTAEGSELTLQQGAQATEITITGNDSAATVPVWNGETFTKVALSGVNAETVKIAAVMDGKVVNADYGVLSKKGNTFTITLSGEGHEFDGYAGKLGTVYFYLYTGATAPAIAADAATALFTLTVEPASLNALLEKTNAEVTLSKTEDNNYTATLKDGVVPFENVTVDSEVVIPGDSKLIVASAALAQMANDGAKLSLTGNGELFLEGGEHSVVTAEDKTLGKFFGKDDVNGLCFQIGGIVARLDTNNGLSKTTLLADFARMVYNGASYQTIKNAELGFKTEQGFEPSGWTHSMVVDLVNVLGESLDFESLGATVMELDDSFKQNNAGVSGTVYTVDAPNTTTKTYTVTLPETLTAATLDVNDNSKLFFQCTEKDTDYAVLAIKMPTDEVTVTQTNPALETAYKNDLENGAHASWWTLANPESSEYIKSKNTIFSAKDCYYCLLLESNTEVTVTAELNGVRTTYLITVPTVLSDGE